MTDLDLARGEAVQEVTAAILMAAGEAMDRHGNDPDGHAIVAAGFAGALRRIGRHIDPNIPIVVRRMLERSPS